MLFEKHKGKMLKNDSLRVYHSKNRNLKFTCKYFIFSLQVERIDYHSISTQPKYMTPVQYVIET